MNISASAASDSVDRNLERASSRPMDLLCEQPADSIAASASTKQETRDLFAIRLQGISGPGWPSVVMRDCRWLTLFRFEGVNRIDRGRAGCGWRGSPVRLGWIGTRRLRGGGSRALAGDKSPAQLAGGEGGGFPGSGVAGGKTAGATSSSCLRAKLPSAGLDVAHGPRSFYNRGGCHTIFAAGAFADSRPWAFSGGRGP